MKGLTQVQNTLTGCPVLSKTVPDHLQAEPKTQSLAVLCPVQCLALRQAGPGEQACSLSQRVDCLQAATLQVGAGSEGGVVLRGEGRGGAEKGLCIGEKGGTKNDKLMAQSLAG